jgi:phosphoribosylformylglycinamidine synthase PurS subunit
MTIKLQGRRSHADGITVLAHPITPTPSSPAKKSLVEVRPGLDGAFLLMKVHVIVMPKRSVLDPQGLAVRNALRETGLEMVEHVRVGKFLELEFSREPDPVKLEEICRDLLSNPVIEDYVVERGS